MAGDLRDARPRRRRMRSKLAWCVLRRRAYTPPKKPDQRNHSHMRDLDAPNRSCWSVIPASASSHPATNLDIAAGRRLGCVPLPRLPRWSDNSPKHRDDRPSRMLDRWPA
jgi:hypothetical protein